MQTTQSPAPGVTPPGVTPHELPRSLGCHLAAVLDRPGARVEAWQQFTVGTARATYGFDLVTPDGRREELVLRLDPPDPDGSIVPSDMPGEYAWYRGVHAAGGVPVPEPLLCESDAGVLGAPFMVMRRLAGHSDWESVHGPEYDGVREELLVSAFAVLGRINALDPAQVAPFPARATAPTADRAAPAAVDHWERMLDEADLGPMPVTRTAIRHLRARLPPPAQRIAVCHGDYRLGNFLYRPDGVVGVLDWEMAHLGDPLEDLAWTLLPNWGRRDESLVWHALHDRDAAFAAWERASGLTVDHDALRWWVLLNHVKATALWVRGAAALARRHTGDVRYAYINWFLTPHQEQWMLQALDTMEAAR